MLLIVCMCATLLYYVWFHLTEVQSWYYAFAARQYAVATFAHGEIRNVNLNFQTNKYMQTMVGEFIYTDHNIQFSLMLFVYNSVIIYDYSSLYIV